MATPVTCGWTGAVFKLQEHLGRSNEAKGHKNIKCTDRHSRVYSCVVAQGVSYVLPYWVYNNGPEARTGCPRAICGQRYPLPCFA